MKHGCSSVMRTAATIAIALVAAMLTACSPWATYPPVEVKTAQKMSSDAWEPVPTVMAEAIRYARERFTPDQDLPVNLPEGTPAAVYDKVFVKLGWGRPLLNPGEPAIHIKEVRTRGFDAQVDLVYTRADGMNQLVTLTLERTMFEGWHVTNSRPWALRNFPAPPPNYVPAPIAEPKPAASEPASKESAAREPDTHAASDDQPEDK